MPACSEGTSETRKLLSRWTKSRRILLQSQYIYATAAIALLLLPNCPALELRIRFRCCWLLRRLAKLPGFVRMTRTVCKSEWAYETEIVFDSYENFQGYMGSDVRENVALKALKEITPLLVPTEGEGEPYYLGNRVSDNF